MDYGIQLFSVRDVASKDYEASLKIVSELGYEYVETAGFFGHSAEQVKAWLDKYNLKVSGAHAGLSDLENDFEGTVKFHNAIGNTKYILPAMNVSTRESLDELVAKINKYLPMLADNGIELGFHNHSVEFVLNSDGIYPYLYLLEKTDIKIEIDIFWAFAAHFDPVTIMEQLRSRLNGCIHLKDGVRYPQIKGYSLGDGAAPLREVMAKAKDMNLLSIVESEGLDPTGPEEIARCADFLKKNL